AELNESRPPPPNPLGGWLELGVIVSNLMFDPAALDRELEIWKSRYPGHPAVAEVLPAIVELAKEGAVPPARLALLLPLEGDFKNAAVAIRDGFLTAWFEDNLNTQRPEVLIRAVNEGEVWSAYQNAVADGAEFIVGPLERSAVDEIAAAVSLPVPTLALNYVSGPEPSPAVSPESGSGAGSADLVGSVAPRALPDLLYQFSLSPEEEARAAAKRAWFDGRTRAGIIAPQGQWGDRVVGAFSTEFERLGGQVVEVQQFASDAVDMSSTIQALLNIDESEERRTQLVRTLGRKVEFEPQRRSDLEVIFMAAFPVQARQLRPLLRFHHAEDVPVYATSHVYSGIPDPRTDIDVDGVIFADMPWTLGTVDDTGIRRSVLLTWRDAIPTYLRLYAFGADAYALVSRLRALKSQPYTEYAGATGHLSVGRNNRIERRLLWARFDDGVPQLIGSP
ncbi:MAG: penicillin-binding protein activator, partial [Gammaproteobacteria bacterium]|nr:penicillin-binding protein activator [Gammaproteobacteria bacterium]